MRAKRGRGFTLLEVLASVAILGIVYTVLAGVAARWLGAEGEARRRMQASLRADQALAELEAQVASGSVPPPGDSETQDENDLYRVVTRVSELPLPAELCASLGAKRPAKAPTLCPTAPGGPSYLRRIDVVVGWEEAGQPLEVQRSTVAFDLIAAAPVLAAIPRPQDRGGDSGGAADGDTQQDAKSEGAAGNEAAQKKPSFGGREPSTPVTQGTRGFQNRSDPEEEP